MSENAASVAVQPLLPDHPDTPDAPQHAWRQALRLAAASERILAQLRATLGLSSNEMNALLLLHDGGPMTMTRLAGRIHLSRAAMSALVDRLERGGWVSRSRDPHDRRSVRLAVTGHFERRLYGASRQWRQRMQNLASAEGDNWSAVLSSLAGIHEVCERSAAELSGEPALTRPSR